MPIRPRPAALLFLLLITLATTLFGCSTTTPRFEVVDVALRERSGEGVVLEFLVEGVNENDSAIPLQRVRYSVNVEGLGSFTGVRSPEATLPRRGAQRFTLPASFAWPEGMGALPADAPYHVRGTMTYLAPGRLARILFDAGLRRPKTSFSERGRLVSGAADPATDDETPG